MRAFNSRPARSVALRIASPQCRTFAATSRRAQVLDATTLPDRITPKYLPSPGSLLLSLHWAQPPRNILLIPKLHASQATHSAVAFAKHLKANYPGLNILFEARIAHSVHEAVPFPVYTSTYPASVFPQKIDLVATLGGDGTILRAASLFSVQESVPPILAFSMGTVGFLGEWKFEEYKRAWREVYMSGSGVPVEDLQAPHTRIAAGQWDDLQASEEAAGLPSGWDAVRGKSMGPQRACKMLLRHRLKVGLHDEQGQNVNRELIPTATARAYQMPNMPGMTPAKRPNPPSIHAINELLIHRGPHPHLAIIDIYLNNHFLTEAVADGILVSTPTGSTAYSLSSGGSIIHPLVKSLLITPICPRSLSFRPLVLPLNTKVSLKLSEKNRGRDLEVSIDGKRRAAARIGMEVRVEGETVGKGSDGSWRGGVPCVIRVPSRGETEGISEDDDGWVGGLNGLLKFNYPFGETPSGS